VRADEKLAEFLELVPGAHFALKMKKARKVSAVFLVSAGGLLSALST